VGQLAEAAPSVENGLWKLMPDGRMETTWRIRQGAQWHDGTPFTTQDLRFTADIVRDPELAAAFRDSAFDMIEAIEGAIVKYDYDPRRAAQAIESLGYTRGADGFFTDAAGHRIGLEIQVTEGLEIQVKATFAVLDAWQQLGAEVKPIVRSSQSTVDREDQANFPSFRLNRQPNSKEDMKRYLIAQAPVAENRYTGFDFARYRNQEFNNLIERYFRTIPPPERVDVLRQVVGSHDKRAHADGSVL